jgi:hypothetical protein
MIDLELLPKTLIFLQGFTPENDYSNMLLVETWTRFQDGLESDGYSIIQTRERRLTAEELDSGSIIFNLCLVLVCVFCAGLASGLTQVSK